MFKDRKKIVSNLGIVKPGNRLLRLLKSELGFQVSLTSAAVDAKEDTYEESQREVNIALAEAEYQKAKATMTIQQVRTYV